MILSESSEKLNDENKTAIRLVPHVYLKRKPASAMYPTYMLSMRLIICS